MADILQKSLPYDPFDPRPLPGIQPFVLNDWLVEDEALAGQMALRDQLLQQSRDAVLAMDDSARLAAEELLDMVLGLVCPVATDVVTRSDGVEVAINRSDPMGTLGRLVQEDLCILQKSGDEHILTGAVLCFSTSWMLEEKFMHPLIGIHQTVDEYDGGMAARVQRLFDGVQPGRPLWRFNALWYQDPSLHQPRSIHARRDHPNDGEGDFLRSERQCILRLPQTGAVVFSIHTYVLARADVTGA
ncbi:MAG: hypothetical protein ACI8R4_002802 [Paracoccaceae bacterium]|jgi:hypothetical protein